ncbi:dihydroxyacetone kinase DhaK subunit [Chelatococcus asaccharovorans]|uniref:Dihydroxyacetone kinase DhaK subunit n=2 Tax=Chelatococcus asaccharovorans TaxID=28210 RepID=A0A2V3TVW8_9HYPH|nr:dihydroxyacetone kinase subunit DhaK [Chelatococcus asaccharovorans]MBS7705124.1 dihydroxyacetone kinase subunit DhaK [Chelatococcus asaccharovorans]PXW53618.1 dihydroxyacetone kinase DhaK subunit [Chelatococcus asaccharovorans]
MKKIMNSASTYVDDVLAGLVLAHPRLALGGSANRVVHRAGGARKGKVGITSGGGSGHLPLFTGYVGQGMLDSCSIGNVFEGPNVESCIDAIKIADGGAGVLRLYGNYGGDRMNFDMAGEFLEGEIETTTVLGTDDVASASPDEGKKRRGVAGIIYAYKIAGAKAEEGADLSAVTATAAKAVAATKTIGLALSPCQVPGSAKPTFEIAADEFELGMGIHGEPGLWRSKLKPADEIVDDMLSRLLEERPAGHGGRVSVLVNSLGATPLEELLIMYRRVAAKLRETGIDIVQPLVGHYATSMEMAGASISLCFLDEELEHLLSAPSGSPFWEVK